MVRPYSGAAVAQLVERTLGKGKVSGSIPLSSTIFTCPLPPTNPTVWFRHFESPPPRKKPCRMEPQAYHFVAPLWIYKSEKASWHFVTVPADESAAIRLFAGAHMRRGWGSVRVSVTIGAQSWQTSIFPDKQSGCYWLPVKAEIRQQAALHVGDDVAITIRTLI